MNKTLKKFLPVLGPLFSIVIWSSNILPAEMRGLGGVMVWVIWWWLFTRISLHITGLLGVSFAVFIGVEKAATAYASFANPLIFLFMGGFFIAKAMEVNEFHRRVSLSVLSHKAIKGNPLRVVIALMLLTTFFSMWISNTATTSIILPIVLGVLAQFNIDKNKKELIIISMAYSATIGGLGTPIGSPPNMIAIGMLSSLADIHLNFFDWVRWAAPIVVIAMGILIYFVVKKVDLSDQQKIDTGFVSEQLKELGKLTLKEKTIVFVLTITILGWLTPSLTGLIMGRDSQAYLWCRSHMPEAVVVMLTTIIMFIFPLGKDKATLTWEQGARIDWGTLLLFGSGISLGKMMFNTGLAKFIGDGFLSIVSVESSYLFVLALIIFSITFTEFASNTASANLLIPIIVITSAKFNMQPTIPVLATAIGCNLAFTLPVATPPNAIVFGTGLVKLKSLIRYGSVMNAICSMIIFLFLSIFI